MLICSCMCVGGGLIRACKGVAMLLLVRTVNNTHFVFHFQLIFCWTAKAVALAKNEPTLQLLTALTHLIYIVAQSVCFLFFYLVFCA